MVVIDMDLEVLKVSSLVSVHSCPSKSFFCFKLDHCILFRDLESNWREERAGSFQDCLPRPEVH